MRILAIDPSLNSTGICYAPDAACSVEPPKGFLGVHRLIWLREYTLGLLSSLKPAMVALEGYSYGSKAHSAISLGEWGGMLRVLLYEQGIPVALVPPKSLKQWLAGTGNASKTVMICQATKRSGLDLTTDDEADAWALYAMACEQYGQPIVKMPDRAAARKGVEWPEVVL